MSSVISSALPLLAAILPALKFLSAVYPAPVYNLRPARCRCAWASPSLSCLVVLCGGGVLGGGRPSGKVSLLEKVVLVLLAVEAAVVKAGAVKGGSRS
jgi:hypothetical protein